MIYVRWDALATYVTTLGDSFDQWWRDGEQVHVIGKRIIRFHAAYWPALLLSAGLPLPKKIFVHEYLTSHGAKISKSSDVRVSPVDMTDECGVGSLFNRVRGLSGGSVPDGPGIELASTVDEALRAFDFRAATGAIVTAVAETNRLIETTKPWERSYTEKTRLLSQLGGACRTIAHELSAFLPSGAARLPDTPRAFPRLADTAKPSRASSRA